MSKILLKHLRDETIGADSWFQTPYGQKMLTYADYTASGRALSFVDQHIQKHAVLYANTHTEDDITGRQMSAMMHDAEKVIKSCVNANEDNCIINIGTGATGAIYRLQQILGIALPAASFNHLRKIMQGMMDDDGFKGFEEKLSAEGPVVFIGPYEHHSNEVSWRSGLATVVSVNLDANGEIDLAHLESLLKDPKYQNRLRVGSFSAASNVTGLRSPVKAITKLLHQHQAFACFDYAASGPYDPIDMNPGTEDGVDLSIDAIYVSPHKFIGGPGSAGTLVFNKRIYDGKLCPSIAGGGTVSYVNEEEEDFFDNIEERENAGTPGILQVLRSAAAFAIKRDVSEKTIHEIEEKYIRQAFEKWSANDNIEVLGHQDPSKRVAIISFNLKAPDGKYLHPKFVTALINDMFGIQTRAGCACAGPYGHRLLGIDLATSHKYRDAIAKGWSGVKPGWCRLGFHFTMDQDEVNFIIDVVDFVASYGHQFMADYNFDLKSGLWSHKDALAIKDNFLEGLYDGKDEVVRATNAERLSFYQESLRQAHEIAYSRSRQTRIEACELAEELEGLRFFTLHNKGQISNA